VPRVSEHALHEKAVPAGCVDAPLEDARLLDWHLTVARRVQREERHRQLPGGVVAAGTPGAPHRSCGGG
jgi:hypothetical protein